jgi:F0F1-type ATP synthase membrane subunit b/b'
MVKNLPSVERSQKIRLGKFTPDTQATDTIVINATSDDITTTDSGLYVAPIRYDATPAAANAIGYDSSTKEVVRTSFPVNQTQGLQEVTSNGAVTTLGVEVSNTFTATRVQVGSGASADDVNVFVVRGGVLIEGNLIATGDTVFVRSNNVSITDPLLELGGNNNSESFVYDVGIIMNRPGENVGFAYLETRDELTVALTSNTATDRFIETSSNLLTMNVVGDVYANAFFGEGSTLTNVAHLDDFQSNVTRISNLETSLASNAQRVGYLETVHASNAQRLSTLETYHDDNVIRLNLLYNLQASNAAELTTLNTWHQSNVTRISNLETWLDDNSVRITNLSSNLADNSARISLLSTWLQDNSFRITTNSDNLSSNHYRLTNVESNLVANSNRITNLTNDVNAIDGRVTVLESETSNLRVDLTSNVSILNNTIYDLSDNAGRVTTLEFIKAPIDNPVFTGIISGDGGGISNIDLQHVTSDGNATTDTVQFTSSTVAFVTDSTVGVGTDNPDTNYTLHATGDIKVESNVEATTFIAPGTHINLDGTNKLTGNTSVYGNLNVYGNVTYLDTENVYVKDPILGIGNPGAQDSGVIAMSGGPGSNVAFGYNNTDGEFIIAFTDDGPLGVTLTPNAARDLNVHVYGTIYTANGFGVANTNPVSDTYALSIGQNVFAKHNGDLISIRSLADTGIFTSNVTTPVIESTGTNLEITAPNTVLMGNLDVRGATTMVSTTDLIVNDTVVDLANNNTLTSVDLGIRMKRPGANVIMAYQASSEELAFAHSVTGVTPDPTKTMNVHVYGNLEVDAGINVGSNVIINDFASNVIDADGSIAATIYYGDGGLLSNITQTLQGISEIGANTDQTIYFTNVTTGVNVTTSNVEVGGYYFGDGQFMTNVANLVILQSNVSILSTDLRTDLQSNVSILNTNIASNVSDLRTDLQSNVSILNTNIASNVSDLRTDLQSNVLILNQNITSNVSDLRTDLQSNVLTLNQNIASNVSDLRSDLQSNVSILNQNLESNVLTLNQNIASNVSDLRTDLQSNVSILNQNIASNVSDLRTDLQSNVSILNQNIASNVSDLRTDLQSNVLILNQNITSNVSDLRTDLQSNVLTLNQNISSNVSDLRTDLQSNVSILNQNITSNVSDLRTDLQSNVLILNQNIASNVSDLRTDLQSNVLILNQNITSNVSDLRTDLQSNVLTLNQNIASNVSDLRTDIASNVSIINSNVDLKADILDPVFSSNITVANNLVMSDLTATRVVFVGADKQLTDDAALTFASSTLTLDADMSISGNLSVEGDFVTLNAVNTIVNDAIVELGNNNSSDTLDLGIIMTRPSTNVAIGYRGDESELMIGHTLSDPSSTDLVPDSANALAVHVYGSVTSNSLDVHGAANVGALTSTELDVLGTANVGALTATELDVLGTANVGALTMTGATLNGDFDMVSTDGGSSAGPEFTLWRNSATPSNGDYLGQIKFAGENSSGGTVNYAKMTGKISEATAGAEDGLIEIAVQNNSVFKITTRFTNTDLKLINGTGLEVAGDVAVDTDTLFVDVSNDRVGVNTSAPAYDLDVRGNANVNTLNCYTIQGLQTLSFDSDNSTTPPLQLTAGSLNDGVGALRIDSVEPDIMLNDTDGGFATVTFANNDVARAAFGRNSGDDFYITVRDPSANGGNWRNDTFVADSSTGDISLGYTLAIGRSSVTGSNVLDVDGSANALVYYGDGGLLSNIRTDFESVIIEGNTTSNVVEFMNATTAFITDLSSNVVMNINQLNNVTITTGDLVDQQILRYDAGNGQWVNDNSDRNFVRVYNGSGSDIAKGKAVYVYDSHNNNVANVALARSDDPSTMPCIGVTLNAITTGTEGYAVAYGKVQGVNTSGFVEGETLYVSNVSAGGVSNIKPYSVINTVDQIQNIGICVKAATNGVVFVTGVGRSNDIPNANVVTSNGDLNYVYVNETNNDMLKIAPTNLLTKLQTLTQVVDTGNVTSNVVQFTNITTGLVATSNVHAGAFYGEGSTLSFTSNVFIDEGLVVNKNSVASKQYAYTGSMTFSNVGVTFSTNVFSAKITAHLVHDDDEVSTIQIDCCGGSKNGTSAHNIVAGKVNKFGVTTSYPWNHEVTTTPTQVIWEPEQAGSTNYDYDIHVELLSSHPSAGVTQITEAGSAVKYFSH